MTQLQHKYETRETIETSNCNIEWERERESLARRHWCGEGATGVGEEGARGGGKRIRGGGKGATGGEEGDATMEEEEDVEVGEGAAANQGESRPQVRREGREACEPWGRASGQ
jgi:hypothetical protein